MDAYFMRTNRWGVSDLLQVAFSAPRMRIGRKSLVHTSLFLEPAISNKTRLKKGFQQCLLFMCLVIMSHTHTHTQQAASKGQAQREGGGQGAAAAAAAAEPLPAYYLQRRRHRQ